MTKEQYMKMTQPYRDDPARAGRLNLANKIPTAIIFAVYPAALVWLFYLKSPCLLKTILIPLDGFIAVSVFRSLVNRKRPYETFQLPPLIPKDTKGKSFPSRHVFSAMVIALTLMMVPGFLFPGMILAVLALVIGGARILSGVHYPEDVAAGILCAVICALVGFLV